MIMWRRSVFVAFILTLSQYAMGRTDCDQGAVFERVARCDRLWGFDLGVFQKNNPDYVLDLNKLVTFCRNPQKPNVYRCLRKAQSNCQSNWEADFRNRADESGRIINRALDYLCSKEGLISQHQSCIQNQIWPISACFRIAGEDFLYEISSNNGGNGQKLTKTSDNIRRMGESIETCVYEILRNNCNQDVTAVFRNFLHGVFVYPYIE